MTESAADHVREGNALLVSDSPGPACVAFCRALNHEPRLAAAHYGIGVAMLLAGQAKDSLPCLMSAAMLQPASSQFIIALARALLDSGEGARAASLLAQACQANPDDIALREAAAQCPPDSKEQPNLDGFASRVSAEVGSEIYADAMAALERGAFDYAFGEASRLIWIAPQSVAVWTLLGAAAQACGRIEYSEMCARRAVALAPSEAGSWIALARLVGSAEGRTDEIAPLWAAALARDPANPDLIIEAVAVHDRLNDPVAMFAVLEAARAAGADFSRGELLDAQARALRQLDRLDEAKASIEAALAASGDRDQLRSRQFTLGAIEDRRGDYRGAHTAFLAGNSLREAVWETEGDCDHTMVTRRIESLHRRLHAEIDTGRSAVEDTSAGPANIAFLVGFPRSGTTLLDTILRSHSRVRVVEEQKILINALRSVAGGMSGDESSFTEDWLDRLDAGDPAELRAAYLRQMASFAGEPLSDERVYIDKLPLNMNWAPLMNRILPRAPFILARRHPLDVAISNLAQDYKPNNAMLNMTSLERIDRLYDGSFALWEAFVDWRKPSVETVVYEDLLDDLEAVVSRVMKSLGLEWEDSQARFFETARKRDRIKTPSAGQVTQELYSGSKERWHNYAFAFEGADTAALRAWALKQGYADE